MKKICFVAVVCISKIILVAHQETPTSLVVAVHTYLEKFAVTPRYNESKVEFLQRIKESKNFEAITYAEYSEKLFQKESGNKSIQNSKRYLLGLFTPDLYVVKNCGFWGGQEDGFHVRSTAKVIGKNLAKLHEKGSYEWVIYVPHQLSGNEFENTPIQPLIEYLVNQKESEILIPLKNSTKVSFFKEEQKITARLQYT